MDTILLIFGAMVFASEVQDEIDVAGATGSSEKTAANHLMFERIRQMLIKEFIQVFRDPRMRAVIFIVPCMEVLVIGYAVNMDIRDIRTAVYDLDNTPASRELLARFSASGYFDVVARVDDDRRMQDLIDRSAVQIVLRINHGFAGDLEAGRTAALQVICDGTDSNTAGIAMSYVNRIASDYAREMLAKRMERPRAWPTSPCGSISAAGRGSTRTWRAATTSCPA